jgi:hypothetical protein
MTDGRIITQLTPNAKQLFRDMYEEGSLDELLETALYGEE